MARDNGIMAKMQDRQLRLARIMSKNGVTLKAVSMDSGIPYNTLRAYFPGEKHKAPAVMPISALVQLFGVLSDEWLSLLTEPEGRVFASSAEEDPKTRELRAMRERIDQLLNEEGVA